MAESNALGHCFHLLPGLVSVALTANLGSQGVKHGSLGSPWTHILHGDNVAVLCAHLFPLVVAQGIYYIDIACSLGVNGQFAVTVVVHQVGSDAEVVNMNVLVASIQITVASHARETPEVLVLAVTAIAPAEHLECNEVFACLDVRCDVELCCHL